MGIRADALPWSILALCGIGLVACNGSRNLAKRYSAGVAGAVATANDPPLTGDAAQADSGTLPGSTGPVSCPSHVYVANQNGNFVAVYPRAASGDVAPLRTIKGTSTGLLNPNGMAFDATNHELLVANQDGPATVFAIGATGDATPLRTFPTVSTDIAVDPVNDEVVIAAGGSIGIYARTGAAAALRTITSTGLSSYGIAADTTNCEIVVSDAAGKSIAVFPRTASGNTTPLRAISGAATQLSSPVAVAVDAVNDELFVANSDVNKITVYARTASGNVAPLRTIAGSMAGLMRPQGIALDLVNNEIFVTSEQAALISVFARTASGNVAPLRTIFGVSTQILNAFGIALDAPTSCPSGAVCASGGCIPSGSVDCNNGNYCPAGSACASANGQTTCVAANGGMTCPDGSYCPAGDSCATDGCIPSGATDCGNGYYCLAGTCAQSGKQTVCMVFDGGAGVMCPDGSYCAPGNTCASPTGCYPTGSADCANGY
jgi:hypothetical protein